MDIQNHSINQSYLDDISKYLAGGGDPNLRDEFQDTFLHIVAKFPHAIQIVYELVSAGADLNSINFMQQTALHIAVIHRNCFTVKKLIDIGARVNIQDCSGNSLLHYAINACTSMDEDWNCVNPNCPHRPPDMDIIRMLLAHEGTDVNIMNSKGYTPLLLAVKDKNLDIVKALLNKFALVNIGNRNFETPLHFALSYPNPNLDIAGELLRCRASFTCKDRNGLSPLDLVFKREGGENSQALAEELLKLVTFFDNKGELYTYSLQFQKHLSSLYSQCANEVEKMRGDIFWQFTLYDILLCRLNNDTSFDLATELMNDIFHALPSRGYVIYLDFILKNIAVV